MENIYRMTLARRLYILIVFFLSIISSQEYKIQFSHIPIGQGIGESESFEVENSIGAILSKDISSDSFAIGAGFIKTTQSVLSEPPVIASFILPDLIQKTGYSVSIMATLYDLNGISSVDLYLQKGANTDEIIIPMSAGSNDEFEAIIPDSLIGIENFRARITGTDNMGSSTTSDYQSTQIQFNNAELTMNSVHSQYPEGIKRNQWKLISWPGELRNISLVLSELEDGHVFYDWDPIKNKYFNPEEIKLGHSYWFRHIYDKPVVFKEDTSTALSLENFVIDLERGWNLIGNPFSFPVTFEKDSAVRGPYSYIDKGWTDPQFELIPWNGYAVYTANESAINLMPFVDQDSSSARIVSGEEWYLKIRLESANYINYSAEIGRRKYAKNGYDIFDTPVFPDLDNKLSLIMDLNGAKPFGFMRDIRSIDELDGVWNLKLDTHKDEKKIHMSGLLIGAPPEWLSVAIVDIPDRRIIYDFLDNQIDISKDSDIAYDLKLVAGSEDFVIRMSEEILANIPGTFSLSQNYPNPFNPITKMNYTLPKRSRVIISIYNVLGQEVKNLINQEQEYGYHSVSWNGIDNQGRQMSSGVYFSRMTVNDFSQTKKMLLVK